MKENFILRFIDKIFGIKSIDKEKFDENNVFYKKFGCLYKDKKLWYCVFRIDRTNSFFKISFYRKEDIYQERYLENILDEAIR